MNEIVDDVLKVEEEAEHIVREAREQAQKEKNALEIELTGKLKQAKEDAQNLIQEAISRAKEETNKEYKDIIEKAEEDNRKFLKENSKKVDEIVENIVNLIITPEYNRE
ncbi:MAG: hypothetical protein JXJ04_11410 [Spirochaetales bacterium]|nr:hypothetical protein [Spirochaetales bacterium]